VSNDTTTTSAYELYHRIPLAVPGSDDTAEQKRWALSEVLQACARVSDAESEMKGAIYHLRSTLDRAEDAMAHQLRVTTLVRLANLAGDFDQATTQRAERMEEARRTAWQFVRAGVLSWDELERVFAHTHFEWVGLTPENVQ
jgi:predicted  nucleic acid-binding Zn-ribbon protein